MEAGFNPIIWIISVLLNAPISNLEPLTVQDLVNSAMAKRWIEK
jgi:hypothetical protein